MRKFLTTALLAATVAGPVLAAAAPAEAQHRRYYGGHRHHGGGNDAAVAAVAGIAGLAIGAAIAGNNNDRRGYSSTYVYRDGPYRNGYTYDPRYEGYAGDYYARGPRTCITRERVYDPYIGRHVRIERSYPC